MLIRVVVVMMVLGGAGARPVSAQVTEDERTEIRSFLSALHRALAAEDARATAAFMRFPLRVNYADDAVFIPNAAEFARHYKQVMYRKVKAVIAEGLEEEPFRRPDHGIMIGDGVIWFDRHDVGKERDEFRVHAINVRIGREEPEVSRLLASLQAAVAARNRAGVAALVAFPVKWVAGGRERRVRTRADFVRRYEAIVTPSLQAAIAASTARTLEETIDGVSVGDQERVTIAAVTNGVAIVEFRGK